MPFDSSGHDAGPLLFVCITQPFGSPRLLLLLGSDVPLVLRLQRLCLAPARDKECRYLTKVIVPTSSGLMKEPIGKSLRQPELPPKRQRPYFEPPLKDRPVVFRDYYAKTMSASKSAIG